MCIIEEMKKAGATVNHQGYYYRLSSIVEILIMGLMCRMTTLADIHAWAISKNVRPMLESEFGITKIPCYSHLTNLVGMIDAKELNKIFMEFFSKLVGAISGKTIAIDGKTICSTANMKHLKNPLHIASAFVVENGITIGQLAADAKSNEIPAVRELIRLLDVEGATIVMDALNCQVATVNEILDAGADYVLSVKKSQKNLFDDIAEMIEFKNTDLCEAKTSPLDKTSKIEKGHGRIDSRTALVTHEIDWLNSRHKFKGIQTIGAIVTKNEIRYYISSRKLTAKELLEITRSQWGVEAMHWQLDVIFGEDITTLHEANTQLTLNILRKAVLNMLKTYQVKYEPKSSLAGITRKCLHDTDVLLDVLGKFADC